MLNRRVDTRNGTRLEREKSQGIGKGRKEERGKEGRESGKRKKNTVCISLYLIVDFDLRYTSRKFICIISPPIFVYCFV